MNNLKLKNTSTGIEYLPTYGNLYNISNNDDKERERTTFSFPSPTTPQSFTVNIDYPYAESTSSGSGTSSTASENSSPEGTSSGSGSSSQRPLIVDWAKQLELGVGRSEAEPARLNLDNLIASGIIDPSTLGQVKYNLENMDVGQMQHIIDAFRMAGINIRVTSGLRPGAKTKQGRMSHHASGNAIDIVPIDGFDKFEQQVRESPALINYLRQHGIGILREYYTGGPTGATGPHVHVGKDKNAIKDLERIISGESPLLHAKLGGLIPATSTEMIRLKRK